MARVFSRLGEKKYKKLGFYMIAVLFVTVSIMEKGCFSSLPFFRIFSFFAYSSNLFFPLLFILLSLDFQRLYLHFLRKKNLSSNQLYINRFIKHIFLFKIPMLICNSTLKFISRSKISSKNSNVILTLLDIIYPYESSKSSNRFVSRYCFPKLTWNEQVGNLACGKLLGEHDKGGAR